MENEKQETKKKPTNCSRRYILMAKSEMAGKMAPTDWGYFASYGEAEKFGLKTFKSLSWGVGEEVTLKDNFGVVKEVKHELVSPAFNSRYANQED